MEDEVDWSLPWDPEALQEMEAILKQMEDEDPDLKRRGQKVGDAAAAFFAALDAERDR